MGFLDAVGEILVTAAQINAQSNPERDASRASLREVVAKHNRVHNDNMALVAETEVSGCPTGLYGWDTKYDGPIGVFSSDLKLCGRCGKFHLRKDMSES